MEPEKNCAGGESTVCQAQSPFDTDLGLRVLAASTDCLKLLDGEGRLQGVNPAGCNVLELDDAATLMGRPWRELWPQAARKAVDDAVEQARNGSIARFTAYSPTMKGTPKWWDVAVSPVFGPDGSLQYLLSASRDVTAQRHAEHRFRALADNMAQLAWIADPGGNVSWLNRRWTEYAGIEPGPAVGREWLGHLHPEHVERVRARMAEAMAGGDDYEDTFPLRAVDGSYGWFLFRLRPVRDESGELQMWCATCTDITVQRNLGTRLRQKARLIELSHEAIFAWDLEKGILLWNKGCEELYGYSKSEAIGANSHELLRTVHPVSRAALDEQLLADGKWAGTLVHTHKDGHPVAVDSRQELMRVDGRDIALETNRDITEKLRAERTREVLLGEIYHRVNNVLAIVQSIAAQTARNSGSMEQFIASFNARLLALSSTHSVLSNSDWSGANLRELIVSQVSATVGSTSDFDLDGSDVALPAQTAIQLGLVLCELASNARRHGSLSKAGGRVSITWQIPEASGGRKLHIVWKETGGPAVQPPERRRFGLTLIERARNLPFFDLDLSFESSGLICRMRADLPEARREQSYFTGIGKGAGRV